MSERLPIELIYYIIRSLDHRSDDDDPVERVGSIPPTLLACSLVCRSWNDLCRPHIFRLLDIDTTRFESRLEFLHATAPHLSKYTHTLRLWLGGSVETHTAPEWIPTCLERLENLEALFLVNQSFTDSSAVPTLFALGIMSLLPSIHLKQLWLEDWVIFNDASDVLFILSTCSTTLEKLTLNVYGAFVNMTLSMPPRFEATLPTIVHLEALRALQLHDRAILQLPNACKIVCPNLEYFTVVLTGWGYWEIPSWVSSSLSELRIRGIVKHDFHAPLLGQSLHPSALIIDISEDELNSPFPQGFACVGEFINALPFPGQLQKLTIKITREIQTWDRALRPTPADYEILSKVLDGLLKHGMLERVDLTIVISVLEDLDRQPPDGAAEVVNLEKAFGGLLKAGVLSSDIVIERKSGEVFRRWSVGQRVEA